MLEQETAQSIWERSLIAVVRLELEQLQYLDSDISDDTGDSDVYAVVSRIGALTDLADEDGFGFSTKGKEALARLDEEAIMIMRARSARTHNVGINHENEEQLAARALYDAVVYNTPWLLSGDDSRHALTISKELFSTPSNRCGEWPGFDIVQRAVRVQDYRAMKLAGPLYEK